MIGFTQNLQGYHIDCIFINKIELENWCKQPFFENTVNEIVKVFLQCFFYEDEHERLLKLF